jgi:hypothetical protein
VELDAGQELAALKELYHAVHEQLVNQPVTGEVFFNALGEQMSGGNLSEKILHGAYISPKKAKKHLYPSSICSDLTVILPQQGHTEGSNTRIHKMQSKALYLTAVIITV